MSGASRHSFLVNSHTTGKNTDWENTVKSLLEYYEPYVTRYSATDIQLGGRAVYSKFDKSKRFTRWFAVFLYLHNNPNSSKDEIVDSVHEYFSRNSAFSKEIIDKTIDRICEIKIITINRDGKYNNNNFIENWGDPS